MHRADSMDKQDSYIAIASLVGFFIDLFSHFPKNIIDFCYRIICAVFGFLVLAPPVCDGLTFLSAKISFLGFLNASPGSSTVPLVYCVCVMLSEPTVKFVYTLYENDLPTFIRRRFKKNDATSHKTKTNERPRRERETDIGGE